MRLKVLVGEKKQNKNDLGDILLRKMEEEEEEANDIKPIGSV